MTATARKLSCLILPLLVSVIVIAQTPNTYGADWKKVDTYLTDNLPASALTEVKKIYTKAKNEKNDVQLIKALLFRINLQNETREDNLIVSIRELEKEVLSVKQPARSLLYSLIADLYWSAYDNQRYRFYSTTSTKYVKTDIDTWSATDFFNRMDELYKASLREEKLLQQTKISQIDPLLMTNGYRYFRPTLYDFLAHRALDHYENDELYVRQAGNRFVLDSPELFADAQIFTRTSFHYPDTAGLRFNALLLLQKLVRFHENDVRKDAFIDVDIRRLEFAKRYSQSSTKDEQYKSALQQIVKKYPTDSTAAYASYLLANIEFSKGWRPVVYNEPQRDSGALVRAEQMSNDIIKKFPKSIAADQARSILYIVQRKDAGSTAEEVNPPERPFRLLIKYRNTDSVYLRIIKTTHAQQAQINALKDSVRWESRLSLPVMRAWTQALPKSGDHYSHSAEIKVDPLPVGMYMVVISTRPDFSTTENILAYHILHVSDISYFGDFGNYYVVNRTTGHPLAGATVQTWYMNEKKGREKGPLFHTDSNGYFQLVHKRSIRESDYSFDIHHSNDSLFLYDKLASLYIYNGPDTKRQLITSMYFFTDRA
ncbi:MAG TPA: hypothetical protein VHM26_01635, partial [Chitinophagaceae bacterium]|nr:hypothetical protein [Chitinophagaceae bacterium]